MKKGTLYQKIIVMLLLLTVFPLFTVGYFGYEYFSKILEEKISKSNLETVEQVKNRLESYITDADSVAKTIANYEEFQRLAVLSDDDQYPIYEQARKFVEFSKLMILTHPEISRITIVRQDLTRVDSLGRYLSFGGNQSTKKFQSILRLEKPTVLSPEMGEQSLWVIPYVQPMYDSWNGKVIGAVIVDLDLQVIQDYLKGSKLLQSGYIVVQNEKGKDIYAPENFHHQTQLFASRNKQDYFLTPEGKKELVINQTSSLANWHIHGIIPYQEISNELNKSRNIILIFSSVICVAVAGVAIFLRAYLVKPIQKLKGVMLDVENGNLQARSNLKRNDEIGKLGVSFNQMIGQLQQLITDIQVSKSNESQAKYLQKEAQYQALQAKIAPHFLYNTLDSISWLARDRGIREITAVVDSLAGMLRYSLDHSTPLVKLSEEYQHVLQYSEIIRFRTGYSIEFDFDVPEYLFNEPIPRFTLQPIVENAFQHGLEPLGGTGKISISAFIISEQIFFEISDNGIGMEPDRIDELMASLLERKTNVSPSSKRIGLANVHDRIKMSYGDPYGIQLFENEECGLTVQINFPLGYSVNYQKSEEMISNLTGAHSKKMLS
jgi:two-component system, sensor histidine kinase YesM